MIEVQSYAEEKSTLKGWKLRLHEVIFESETPAGKLFDIALIFLIIVSVLTIILESVSVINNQYGYILIIIEWIITILFTIEYLLRCVTLVKPQKYMKSFYGIIDILSFIPTYLSIIFVGIQVLVVIRVIRLLRLFRVFKMTQYVSHGGTLIRALKASKYKIIVFLFTVITIIIFVGSIMYFVEGPANGFVDIPTSMYWATVTLTTVGFGDIVPHTTLGKIISTILMVLGYGIIAVPTGIVSVEMAKQSQHELNNNACPSCGTEGHDTDAKFCKKCGAKL